MKNIKGCTCHAFCSCECICGSWDDVECHCWEDEYWEEYNKEEDEQSQ